MSLVQRFRSPSPVAPWQEDRPPALSLSNGGEGFMSISRVPSYAVFDDHTYSQRIAVMVRWFLLATFMFLIHYRKSETDLLLYSYTAMSVVLGILNGYVH